jgi:hypothetical protein
MLRLAATFGGFVKACALVGPPAAHSQAIRPPPRQSYNGLGTFWMLPMDYFQEGGTFGSAFVRSKGVPCALIALVPARLTLSPMFSHRNSVWRSLVAHAVARCSEPALPTCRFPVQRPSQSHQA